LPLLGCPAGVFFARNQAVPPIVKASYGNNPGFFVLIFGADAVFNFGMTIAIQRSAIQ
jgi:hypothetical protein